MKTNFLLSLLFTGIIGLLAGFFYKPAEWTPLLDKDLSQWEMYLSYRHKPGYGGEEIVDVSGRKVEPIGYNNNVNNVFTVIQEQGEDVLRISGEIYGCVFTKQEYENYHLKLQVKWGTQKWEPRLNEYMDSGILYHSQGECGVDYWKAWMLSQELQIIEKGMGDYWSIASSQVDIKAGKPAGSENFLFNADTTRLSFGTGTGNGNFCQVSQNLEKPMGEWNTIELICYGDKSLHIVNGQVVMAISNSRYLEGLESIPLAKGKIQLQSEAAEVFFKNIQIRNIESFPQEYAVYF